MSLPPITKPDMIGSGHNSPEAWMMWEQFGHVGNSQTGEAFQRIQETNEKIAVRTSGNYIYVGYAIPGTLTSEAKWKIKRVDTTSGVDILYADANAFYDNVFDDYATLTYN
jgi:hypothetical protein